MKTIRQWTAILLGIAILTALFFLPAAAADGTETPAAEPVFLTNGDLLCGIDFSPVIRDAATINTGLLILDVADKYSVYALFDTQTGTVVNIVRFNGVGSPGGSDETDGFSKASIRSGGADLPCCLHPVQDGEMLFDDVASFSFTMRDVFSAVQEAQVELIIPIVRVAEAQGETVKKMTLDFTHAETSPPMIFDRTDTTKTITLTVFSTLSLMLKAPVAIGSVTLRPVEFDAETGVLTVSALDRDGKVGFPLYDLFYKVDGDETSMFSFSLSIPDGLLRSSRNEKVRSAAWKYDYGSLCLVEGMPIRIGAEFPYPSWADPVYDRIFNSHYPEKVKDFLDRSVTFIVRLIQFPACIRMLHALAETWKNYQHPNLTLAGLCRIPGILFRRTA